MTAYTRETLKAQHPHLADSVSVYRAGYAAQDRREIERALFRGQLLAVAATNALELGIDVGDLDVTLHLGFPGTVASLWQQAGRSGRRGQPSLAVYIAFDGPLDQYFMKQPSRLFQRPIEVGQCRMSSIFPSCGWAEYCAKPDGADLGFSARRAASWTAGTPSSWSFMPCAHRMSCPSALPETPATLARGSRSLSSPFGPRTSSPASRSTLSPDSLGRPPS